MEKRFQQQQQQQSIQSQSQQPILTGQLSIISPESEQSSQVTSVTNCSELLQTTGTTFSSEGTGSGSAYPFAIDPQQPGPSTELIGSIQTTTTTITTTTTNATATTSNKFHPTQLIASGSNSNNDHGGHIFMGGYALDFDDDDDDDDDDDNDYDDDDDDEVYEMETTESGNNNQNNNQIDFHHHHRHQHHHNVDFAMAEGSSQDDEEKAKFELEFETTEDDICNDDDDEYDMDNYYCNKNENDKKNFNKIKRPNELNVVSPVDVNRYYRSNKEKNIVKLSSSSSPSPSPEIISNNEKINNIRSGDDNNNVEQSTTTTTTTILSSPGRVTYGTSKSLPENLFRSVDDPEMMMIIQSPLKRSNNDGERKVRLSRTKSSTFGRRRDSNDHYIDSDQQTNKLYSDNQQRNKRFDTIDSRTASDLTPLQDIYSSDPSTTIDLSIANTVIEKQEQKQLQQNNNNDDNEHSIDENESNKLRRMSQEKAKRFSAEIFEKLNITPESYANENRMIGNELLDSNDIWEAALNVGQNNSALNPVCDTMKKSKKLLVTDFTDENLTTTTTTATITFAPKEKSSSLVTNGNTTTSNQQQQSTSKQTTKLTKSRLMTPSLRQSILNQMIAIADAENDDDDDDEKININDSNKTKETKTITSTMMDKSLQKNQEETFQSAGSDELKRKLSNQTITNKRNNNNHKLQQQRSIYDSTNNSRTYSNSNNNNDVVDICKSNSTKSSSINDDDNDDDDDDDDSQTFSIENLPEDSTTSGSFMLDDVTSNNTSDALNGSYLISDSISGSTSRNFYSVSNDLMDDEPLMDNRMGKSEPATSELIHDQSDVDQNYQSMPCNINRIIVAKQIGGENPNYLRVRFEQRQRKAMERNDKNIKTKPTTTTTTTTISSSTSQSQDKSSQDDDNNKNPDEDYTCTDNFFGKYQKILDSQYEEPTNRIISTNIRQEQSSISNKIVTGTSSEHHESEINRKRKQQKQHRQTSSSQAKDISSTCQQQLQQQQQQHLQSGNNHNNNHNHNHPIGQHHQYCNTTDMFEQSSQATERDVERSEFSLQNQNSELDEDESLTFENLNNQSLSVIDEDSKGDQESGTGVGVQQQKQPMLPQPPSLTSSRSIQNNDNKNIDIDNDKHLATGSGELIQTLSQLDSSGDKSELLEERDLSLEAVLQEESKELERVKAAERLERHSKRYHHSHHHQHQQQQQHGNNLSHNTLIEDTPTTCHTSTTFQLNTMDDSSRDILDTSHNIIVHDDEERTELRDERIALLTSSIATNDSSDGSGLPSNNDDNNNMNMNMNARQKFNRKMKEIERRILSDQHHHNQIVTEKVSKIQPKNDQHQQEIARNTFNSHNNSTYSECSSITTPDHKNVIMANTAELPSILKHNRRGQSQPPPIAGASSTTGQRQTSNVAFANQLANDTGDHHLHPSSISNQHCCSRCYHRHHHHHHHHRHPRHPVGSANHHRPSTTAGSSSSTKHSVCLHHGPSGSSGGGGVRTTSNQDEIIIQARARSLTRNLGVNNNAITGTIGLQNKLNEVHLEQQQQQQLTDQIPAQRQRSPCNQHHFTCSHCGESTMPPNLVPIISTTSRFKRRGMPQLSRKSFTVEDVYFDVDDEENDIGVHSETYRSSLWIYIGRKEELNIWNNLNRAVLNRSTQEYPSKNRKQFRFPRIDDTNNDGSDRNNNNNNNTNSSTTTDTNSISISTTQSESEESTASEKNFRQRYETVTHRLIHRKASIELYRRILDQTFTIDKCLTLTRDNNEFGFRIHGNRPVVVSAVEKGTSAQHKGLEVGDIIVAVNGHTVLDSSHSEVVRMAHHGHSLKLEVASTATALKTETAQASENEPKVIINGYLSRFIDKLAEKCSTSRDKMTNPKLWRRRWFVLKSDACLYWYRNPKSLEPIGAISLQGYCAGMVNECLFGQEHLFRLVGYKTTKCKYLAAIDHATAIQWVKALNQNSIQYSNSDAFIDNTLHNIHRNPLNFINPDCYGFLWKFNQIKMNWKQRYFVLKDACLYFYADANSTTALGLFFLHGYRVQANVTFNLDKQSQQQQQQQQQQQSTITAETRKHIFEIVPSDSKYRHIWLCADSESDRKRWTYALEYSIDRWIRLK
uniref:Probable serine/threonine-protein kinase DDB_G0282963 n=1 Tax=Dermatophagoides pteronyssinus TaxID=6956 RepID=A0A6P6XNV7_DERPT|nr:probable serine/threonine-protein kinase DDB_G0282963 [Dermatophagoides pteronyssinus]